MCGGITKSGIIASGPANSQPWNKFRYNFKIASSELILTQNFRIISSELSGLFTLFQPIAESSLKARLRSAFVILLCFVKSVFQHYPFENFSQTTCHQLRWFLNFRKQFGVPPRDRNPGAQC